VLTEHSVEQHICELRRPLTLKGRLGSYTKELRRHIWQPALVVEANAPIHDSAEARAMRAHLRIDRLSHPPSSPDLNPIEHLWALVKHKIAHPPQRATSALQLWEYVQEAWEAIPMKRVNKIIDSGTKEAGGFGKQSLSYSVLERWIPFTSYQCLGHDVRCDARYWGMYLASDYKKASGSEGRTV